MVVRLLLTIMLLVVVWMHAHWSVALCLTLCVIALELMVHIQRKLILAVKTLKDPKGPNV